MAEEQAVETIRFEIDSEFIQEAMTVQDYILLESRNMRAAVHLLAKCMIDANGQRVPEDVARQRILKMKLKELNMALDGFIQKFEHLSVNPPNGRG